MIELNISKLQKAFTGTTIFSNITFDLKTKEIIGLVGSNGCGKTTLLKIISKEESSDLGVVSFRKGANVGYLDQIPNMEDGTKVLDILKMPFEKLNKLGKTIELLTESFDTLKDLELEKALRKYSILEEEYEKSGGYLIDTTINKVTSGLKITEHMREMLFTNLSGGEKTRVMLAKILLEQPTILLLDEPSNHLDLESIEWLESYLKEYDGSALVVSHDRYFLDNVCNKIVELTTSKANIYNGNYSFYVIEKERRFLLELKVYLNQEKKMKRMEDQIKQYRIWGVMRDSDKMFKRAKELEKRLEKIEKLDKPSKQNNKLQIKNIQSSRSGKRVLEITGLSKQFDGKEILKNVQLEVFYQDRLGILGPNGSGKTTIIKLVLEDYAKEEQLFHFGSKVKIGYLPQEIVFPNEEEAILDYFTRQHNISQIKARRALATASFIRDDVFKKIKTLSGGEKSKLILCSLTYEDVNLMVLDEPTNHLDIDSRESLEDLLMEYKGTILFVSHDRYFINKVGDRIAEINNKQLDVFEGDYEYYKLHKIKTESNQKLKKEKRIKQKLQTKVNVDELIRPIEKRLEDLESLIKEHSFDYHKLDELFKEKETLEIEYLALLEE